MYEIESDVCILDDITKIFNNKLKNKFKNKFTLLSKYVSSTANITVKCNDCGLTVERSAVKLLMSGSCRGCAVIKMTKSHEQFVLDVAAKHGDKYTVIGKYVKDAERVLVRHNECGAEYLIKAGSLIQTGGCKYCKPRRLSAKSILSNDKFLNLVAIKGLGEYVTLEKYKGANELVLFKHLKCGFEYKVKPNMFLNQGTRCPKCAMDNMRTANPISRQIGKNIRSGIIHTLQGRQKASSSTKLLGCSINELKHYLSLKFTDGMSWDNYGKKDGWQVDHIKPCASFDFSNERDQHECFHYTNLQPLWAKDNILKSSWYNGVKYDKRKKSSS